MRKVHCAASVLAVWFVLGAVLPTSANAGTYVITDLGTLGGKSGATAINNSGVVIGYSEVTSRSTRAFIYDSTGIHDLGSLYPDSFGSTYARDINSSGQIVGDSEGRAFLYDLAGLHDLTSLLPYPVVSSSAVAINDRGDMAITSKTIYGDSLSFLSEGGVVRIYGLTSPAAINSSNQIAGTGDAIFSERHATLYSGGVDRDLGTLAPGYTPTYNNSYAHDINDAGQVVGSSRTYSGEGGAFLYEGGVMNSLGGLGRSSSSALAINASGQIVGYSGNSAFLYSAGTMYDLNSALPINSGWLLSYASDINDRGQIVGGGVIDGRSHAFLLTPEPTSTPEPATHALVGVCIAVLALRRLRRETRWIPTKWARERCRPHLN